MEHDYRNGIFLGSATVKVGRFDIFRMGEGFDCRHIGTFISGKPQDVEQGEADLKAIVDGLAEMERRATA